jgi:hypothetical protein
LTRHARPPSARGPVAKPRELRIAWLILAAAMLGSAALSLSRGSGLSFSGDDFFYYARLVDRGGKLVSYDHLTASYVLAPHNGHLQAGGRLLYEGLFGIAGSNYAVFRLVNTAGYLLCVGLFFELARRRVGPLPALPPSVLLLFFGFAWEPMLWPFDLHTVYALAAGLGAFLALERNDRAGDVVACVLLIVSVATIEVGLAFVAGATMWVLIRPGRLRRAWIFLTPIVLYAAWSLWARRFHQSQADFSSLVSIVKSMARSSSALLGSMAGRNPAGAGVYPYTVGFSTWGWILTALASAALLVRLLRGRLHPAVWAALATLLAYWFFIAVAGRSPDSSRYMLVGATVLLLLAAAAAADVRLPKLAVGLLVVIVAVALPRNLTKLNDGRRFLLSDAQVGGTEYAMLELAGRHARPRYAPSGDPAESKVGPAPLVGLTAGQYLHWYRRRGSIAHSLPQVRGSSDQMRLVADVVLTDALGLGLQPARQGGVPRRCVNDQPHGGAAVEARLPRGSALIRSTGSRAIGLRLRRFATAPPYARLGRLPAGTWEKLRIPPDAAPDPWFALAGTSLEVCPLAG